MTRSTSAYRRAAYLPTAVLIISGTLAAFAVCWPFRAVGLQGQPVWWLQVAALSVLSQVVINKHEAKQAFTSGLLFSTAWLVATFWWLYVAMNTYGGLPALGAAVAVVVLAIALSLYYSCALVVYWRLRNVYPLVSTLAFSALWTLAEMARGTWFTGFGWGSMSYAHTEGPMTYFAPFVGSYGVGALAAWLAASAAKFGQIGAIHRAACLALLCIGSFAPVIHSTESNGHLSVTLLQGNIPQDEKFESGTGIPQALSWYADQFQVGRSDVVLAPETAIPSLPSELPEGYWNGITRSATQGKFALLTGIPLGDYAQGYTNSVIAIQPSIAEVWRYDKHHLVPFGEFIPPLFKWFTRMMHIPLGDFNRGAEGQPSFQWKGERIGANICYEDLFGEELGARFIEPKLAPTIFANVSNLGWFGDTIAIDQHLQISRMRALEFQRPFLRATNTGATVIMDYQGNITASLPRLTQGSLKGEVEGRTGTTPYAWWVSRFGLWPIWCVALAVVAWAWRFAQRR